MIIARFQFTPEAAPDFSETGSLFVEQMLDSTDEVIESDLPLAVPATEDAGDTAPPADTTEASEDLGGLERSSTRWR